MTAPIEQRLAALEAAVEGLEQAAEAEAARQKRSSRLRLILFGAVALFYVLYLRSVTSML